MPETPKVLGQSAPLATTLTDLYTVPRNTTAEVNTVVVCNRAATSTSFRISIAVDGAANSNEQYLYYDVVISGNDTFNAGIGATLGADDVVRVYAGAAQLSFNAFGLEIT
jgi:hypothetical protein